MFSIIIVEDEKIKRITMTDFLLKHGFHVESFENPVTALKYFEEFGADLVITDIRMKGMNGMDVLKHIQDSDDSTEVIMITAYGTVESAVEAMKTGAYDYLTKPFSNEQLLLRVNKLVDHKNLKLENLKLRHKLEERYSFHQLIGKSKVMQELYDQIETISRSDMPVLIEGESGTGKELVANAIHYNSRRKNEPFIKLSCAMLNESLLESELFGHEKGAFTGAYKTKKGRFELADGGTLFLDDVDDIPVSFQVKLLRIIQEQEFERVGGSEPIKVNVRIISATKIDLLEKVENNEFREDLYYRLNVIPLALPPLCDRKEDIPLLINHFINKAGISDTEFSPEALDILSSVNWPGNIRQLENAVYRLTALAGGKTITPEMIPDDIICCSKSKKGFLFSADKDIDLENTVSEFEKHVLNWALEKTGGNQSKAAEILNIKRTTLRDKLKKYSLI